jgi:spermidine/putrescine transport system permease protein
VSGSHQTASDGAGREKLHLPSGISLLNWLLGGWAFVVFAFFYLPILLLAIYSFNDGKSGVKWGGLTTKWYEQLFRNTSLLQVFQNSLVVAVTTTVLSTILGTLGAWLLHRYRYPMARTLGTLVFIPMAIPEVLMGASLLTLFWMSHVPRGFGTLVIAHTTFCFPFVMVGVQARLEGIDPFLEEAAMDLGARPREAFFLVIVPYLLPAIISGAMMAFTLSLDEFIVTQFTTGGGFQTLPQKVYGLAKKGFEPQLNALSTIFVGGTIVIVMASEFLRRTRSR